MQKALELLKMESERSTLERPRVRVYTPDLSPNLLVFEMDSETAEAHDAFWAAYNKDPGVAAFQEKWHALVERSLGDERWEVTEL
jgi:hypothetical protein